MMCPMQKQMPVDVGMVRVVLFIAAFILIANVWDRRVW